MTIPKAIYPIPPYVRAQEETVLIIKFVGIVKTVGNMKVCLTNDAQQFLTGCLEHRTIAIDQTDKFEVIFRGIPKGTYAVSVFQDLNSNDKLDTRHFFKIPAEPFGFSNNPTLVFGPPSFKHCSFVIEEERHEITIQIKNL